MKAVVKANPAPGGVSPISGTAPPVAHRFKPGQRPKGAGRSAGASLIEWANALHRKTEDELRAVADNARAPMLKRHAARAILEGELDLEALLDRVAGKPRQAVDVTTTAAEPERVVPVEMERLPLEFKREMLDLADRIEAWQAANPEAPARWLAAPPTPPPA